MEPKTTLVCPITEQPYPNPTEGLSAAEYAEKRPGESFSELFARQHQHNVELFDKYMAVWRDKERLQRLAGEKDQQLQELQELSAEQKRVLDLRWRQIDEMRALAVDFNDVRTFFRDLEHYGYENNAASLAEALSIVGNRLLSLREHETGVDLYDDITHARLLFELSGAFYRTALTTPKMVPAEPIEAPGGDHHPVN